MATNLHIDAKLLDKAMKLGKVRTKRETVNLALQEFIRRRQVEDLLALAGTIEYWPGQDPVSRRRRARRAENAEQ